MEVSKHRQKKLFLTNHSAASRPVHSLPTCWRPFKKALLHWSPGRYPPGKGNPTRGVSKTSQKTSKLTPSVLFVPRSKESLSELPMTCPYRPSSLTSRAYFDSDPGTFMSERTQIRFSCISRLSKKIKNSLITCIMPTGSRSESEDPHKTSAQNTNTPNNSVITTVSKMVQVSKRSSSKLIRAHGSDQKKNAINSKLVLRQTRSQSERLTGQNTQQQDHTINLETCEAGLLCL